MFVCAEEYEGYDAVCKLVWPGSYDKKLTAHFIITLKDKTRYSGTVARLSCHFIERSERKKKYSFLLWRFAFVCAQHIMFQSFVCILHGQFCIYRIHGNPNPANLFMSKTYVCAIKLQFWLASIRTSQLSARTKFSSRTTRRHHISHLGRMCAISHCMMRVRYTYGRFTLTHAIY